MNAHPPRYLLDDLVQNHCMPGPGPGLVGIQYRAPYQRHTTLVYVPKVELDRASSAASQEASNHSGHSKVPAALLRVLTHGLVIDIEGRESGVVHLVVRADQQHRSLWGRLRQHLANALFRAGRLCHPSNNNRPIRVVQSAVPAHALNNDLPHAGHQDAVEVTPLHTANGDAHYQPLIAYEGVKEHGDRLFPFCEVTGFGRQKGADDSHGPLLKVDWAAKGIDPRAVVILPDDMAKGGAA